MFNNSVEIHKEIVTKISSPKLMEIEVLKTIRAREIGQNSGLFYVPQVLDYDELNGLAKFERVQNLIPIFNVLINSKFNASIIEQISSSLAVIHESLILPDKFVIELPPYLRLNGTEVFIHGDFNCINVNYLANKHLIVILDWQMTALHGGESTYGTRYFDLLWFINYLLWNPKAAYFFVNPIEKIIIPFLQIYFSKVNLTFDQENFKQYCKVFFENTLQQKRANTVRRKRLFFIYSYLLSNRFLKSLH